MLIWLALSDGELIIAPKNIYNHTFKLSMLQIYRPRCLKGILHQKIFYRLNLIWIEEFQPLNLDQGVPGVG